MTHMKTHIKSYTSDVISADIFDELDCFIKKEIQHDTSLALANMGWTEPAGFLYNVKHQLRWRKDQGCIYVAYDDTRAVAISCVEHPEGDTSWAIGGIRTWITSSYRTQMLPSILLNNQMDWAIAKGCAFMLLSFNEYNQGLYSVVKSRSYQKSKAWSGWWDDCLAVEEPITIRHTKQWCLIKPLGTNNADNLEKLLRWAK